MMKVKHIVCITMCLCLLFSGCVDQKTEMGDEGTDDSAVSEITDDKTVEKPVIKNDEFRAEMEERFENMSLDGEKPENTENRQEWSGGKKPEGNGKRPAGTGGAFKKPNKTDTSDE